MTNVLIVKDLKKVYKSDVAEYTAVHNVNLSLNAGEKIAIIGKSGSGKSTFLNSIIGSVKITEGSVNILGKDIGTASDKDISNIRASDIGVVYQFHHLLSDFSVLENIIIAQNMANYEDKEKAQNILKKVGLSGKENRFASELSGGEKQRAAIARALVNDPKIIIADEPTGNLDEDNAMSILDLLLKLDAAIIMVTHDMDMAKSMEQIYSIKNNTLIKEKVE